MALQNVHNKEMRLVLSSDAKPRLKWTSELHQCFVDAVNQLGGPEKATPKSLMRVMGIHGLTLYHLKSHLQKYRLGRTQQSQTYQQNKAEDDGENQRAHLINKISNAAPDQTNESLKVAQALTLQMEAQRKLHEQIEVLRHLQLRIDAQGKYFQSVLRKAQETLSGYSSCSVEVEQAKARLSQLMSMVTSGCPSSSFSVLTESDGSVLRDAGNKLLGRNGYSVESSLTSSESSGRKEETEPEVQVHEDCKNPKGRTIGRKRTSAALSLMDMHPSANRKRSKNTGGGGDVDNVVVDDDDDDDDVDVDDDVSHKAQFTDNTSSHKQVQRFQAMKNIDLNCKYLSDFDSDPKAIDLNFNGAELYNGSVSAEKQY